MMGSCTCAKYRRRGTKIWQMNLIHPGSMSSIESMMEWFNKYAPGFMCVGRKPHPFGNERHTICRGVTSIYCGEHRLFEGKDRPPQLGPKEGVELGATVGLMLQMCRPILGTTPE